MASRRKYRDQYLRWHKTYEKRATTELRKVFRTWIKRIEWDKMQAGTYTTTLDRAFNQKELERAYSIIYTQIGKVHGKRVEKDINTQTKALSFLTFFERNVAEFLRRFGIGKIKTVRRAFFEYIRELLSERLEKEQDMREVARQIRKEVNRPDFYKWQAERIARTESTGASNYAALQAADNSLFEMQKEWISATDKRTRTKPTDEFDHLEMNGKRVALNAKFVFNGGVDELDYPGDPTGEAGNIINCRCTVAPIPKRDSNGNLIPKVEKTKAGFDPNQARNPDGTWGSGGAIALEDRPCFKEWFKDSKVKESDGKPKVMYHGTNSAFDAFSIEHANSSSGWGSYGMGFYLTNSRDYALNYGDDIMELYASSKNPYIISYDYSLGKQVLPTDDFNPNILTLMNTNKGVSRDFTERLKELNYDSVLSIDQYGDEELVLFKPNQIKSVDAKSFCDESNIHKSKN